MLHILDSKHFSIASVCVCNCVMRSEQIVGCGYCGYCHAGALANVLRPTTFRISSLLSKHTVGIKDRLFSPSSSHANTTLCYLVPVAALPWRFNKPFSSLALRAFTSPVQRISDGVQAFGQKLRTFGRQHLYDKTFGRKTFGRHMWDVWEKILDLLVIKSLGM